MATLYDPPEGWRYGFPREYKPLVEETIEETLRRDGYPEAMMIFARWTTFIGVDVGDIEIRHDEKVEQHLPIRVITFE